MTFDGTESLLVIGRIVTMDPARPSAAAMAVRGSRILGVGDLDEMRTLAGRDAHEIDAGERTVIPGIIDAHAHMEREGLKTIRLSLAGATSISEILARIATAAERTPKGEWIVTMPVGEPPYYFGGPKVLAEGRMPTRQEIDRVAPNHPVYVSCSFNNWGEPPAYASLNSLGLARNGITARTQPSCAGVEMVRDEAGEPTGVFVEHNQRPTLEFDLLTKVPRFGYEQRLEALRQSIRAYHSAGTTGVYEGHGSAAETIALYRDLDERGELTMRAALVVSPTWTDSAGAAAAMRDWLPHVRGAGIGDEWLRISGVFIALGGDADMRRVSLEALPDTGWSGFVEQANSLKDYRDYVRIAAENGLRVHTIASQKVDEVLAVWREMDEAYGIRDKRWVLEHLAVVTPEQIAAMRALGVHATTIPSKAHWKRGYAFLEGDAGERLTPHRAFVEAGVPIAIGSDNIPFNAMFGLWSLVTRKIRKGGQVVGPGQCLPVDQALALITAAGARLSFDEARRGTLTPGKLADFVVLDRDLLMTPPDEIGAVGAEMTFVGGRMVHGPG